MLWLLHANAAADAAAEMGCALSPAPLLPGAMVLPPTSTVSCAAGAATERLVRRLAAGAAGGAWFCDGCCVLAMMVLPRQQAAGWSCRCGR